VKRLLVVGVAAPRQPGLRRVIEDLFPGGQIDWADCLESAGAPAGHDLCLLEASALRAGHRLTAPTLPPVVVLASANQPAQALAAAEAGAAACVSVDDFSERTFSRRLDLTIQAALEQRRRADLAAERLELLRFQQVLTQASAAGAPFAALLQLAADQLHARLGYDYVAIFLAEPGLDQLALVAVAGVEAARIPSAAYYLKLGQGSAGQAAQHGRLVWRDSSEWIAPALSLDQPLTELSVPIRNGDRLLGVLILAASQPDRLRSRESVEFEALAGHLAHLILPVESRQREAEQVEREHLLTRISHVASHWLDPVEMLHQAIDALGKSLRADRSTLSVFDLAERLFAVTHEHINPLLTERRSLKRREPLEGALAQVAELLRAGDVILSTEEQVYPGLREYWDWLVRRHGVRSLIWVPIPGQTPDRLYAFSLMQLTHARQWTEADVALLRGIADQLALALRSAELFDGVRRAAGQLEAKNAELEAFVYTVSHDLQAPVVSMRGFATLLQSRYQSQLDERGAAYVARILANADFLARLLQDLLELSRVGRQEEPDESVSVQAVVGEVVQDLGQALAERNVALTLPAEWPRVRYSRTRLRQVFSNLLTNAVKFLGPQPQPSIEVGWQAGATDQDDFPALIPREAAGRPAVPPGYVEFYVRDNGIGIHPDYQQRIFVPFERLKQVDVAGTGVGLSIVKRIVESRGGVIRVESQPDQGATFFFTLPLARDAAPAAGGSA